MVEPPTVEWLNDFIGFSPRITTVAKATYMVKQDPGFPYCDNCGQLMYKTRIWICPLSSRACGSQSHPTYLYCDNCEPGHTCRVCHSDAPLIADATLAEKMMCEPLLQCPICVAKIETHRIFYTLEALWSHLLSDCISMQQTCKCGIVVSRRKPHTRPAACRNSLYADLTSTECLIKPR